MTFIEGEPILRQAETSEFRGGEKPLLTPQDREILKLAARGLSNRQIGKELGIAQQTVKNHFSQRFEATGRGRIFEKLGVQSRTEAVIKAIRLGYIKIEEI